LAQLRILYFQCIPDERRGDSWIDVGGHENEREIMGVKVMRRDKHGQEVPYIVLPFPNRSAVAGVILGPNNSLSDHEVRRELANLGFSGLPFDDRLHRTEASNRTHYMFFAKINAESQIRTQPVTSHILTPRAPGRTVLALHFPLKLTVTHNEGEPHEQQ